MREKISIVLMVLVSTFLLLSCAKQESSKTEGAAKTGNKTVVEETVGFHGEIGPDSHGWLITADNEKKVDDIVSAKFDCVLLNKHEYVVDDGLGVKTGALKSDLSKQGIYDMKVGGAKLDWHEQIALVEKYFVENDGLSEIKFDDSGHDVDGVTSASIHFSEFGEAADAAVSADEAVYTRVNEDPRDTHCWKPYVIYQVKADRIISATIDCFLGDPYDWSS